MSHTVTIIDSIKPAVVRKKYTMTDDVMKKTVIACPYRILHPCWRKKRDQVG